MEKTKRSSFFALALAVVMVFLLAACSASSSSTTTTTFSTSKTDENGNTTTNTTTTEVGVSVGTDGVHTTNQTTTQTTTDAEDEEADPEAEAAELTDLMYALYNGGAIGANADGDVFYYAWNDENDNLMIAVMTADHSNFTKWHGWADVVDNQTFLTGYEEGECMPFDLLQTEDDVFTLRFLEGGDEAEMEIVDYDEFVETFVNDWVYFE